MLKPGQFFSSAADPVFCAAGTLVLRASATAIAARASLTEASVTALRRASDAWSKASAAWVAWVSFSLARLAASADFCLRSSHWDSPAQLDEMHNANNPAAKVRIGVNMLFV
jgi:hypothetical protein